MNKKVFYIVLGISLAINLFMGGMFAGKMINKHLPFRDKEHHKNDHHAKMKMRTLCKNVSPEVKKIEKDMINKNRNSFKENLLQKKKIVDELQQEFTKSVLDEDKIKELFKQQIENTINAQEKAQMIMLDTVKMLSPSDRKQAICINRTPKNMKQRPKNKRPKEGL